ncbi:ABC transporter permease [Frondihabitans australicus]|uniref:ABC transporter permease n=1 Tax=Frondihabitans australicus TaxID=386892 RepID=A0A495ILI0_9MICO|nr:ABC transporter permease [Frondihabitans australicus]RKR76288.1 hypothetical protein C8E83_3455 [Frondihabitans australicus]
MSTTATPVTHRTAWARTVLLAVAAAVAVAVILLAFIWPTMTSSVKDLPVAVSGTSQQVAGVKQALDKKSPGAFDVTRVASRADAVKLIRTRDVDGAIVLPATFGASAAAGGTGSAAAGGASAAAGATAAAAARPEVLTASANGAAVTQIMTGVASGVGATVHDVVPLSSQDSRGLGLSAASFPLVLGGILGGILIALTVTGSWRRLVGVGVYAVLAGVGVTSLLQGLFGILLGSFWLNAAAISLTMAATASFVVGMNALIGRMGVPLGSVTTMLVGNPLSAATQPEQFLVGPWGAVGQWFVPGASTTLVRDLSYFPDANPTFAWLVLAGWAVLGLVATVAGHFRNQEDVRLRSEDELALEPSVDSAASQEPAHAPHPSHRAPAHA